MLHTEDISLPPCPQCGGAVSIISDIRTWKLGICHEHGKECSFGAEANFNSRDEIKIFWPHGNLNKKPQLKLVYSSRVPSCWAGSAARGNNA